MKRKLPRIAAGLALLLALWALLRSGWTTPANPALELQHRFASTRFMDREGRVLQTLTATENARHRPQALHDISPHLIAATLALEDQHFWQHPGLDPLAMLRAAGQNLRARRVVSGASTLTQQLCKWMAPRPRTVWGKFVEAVQATNLESRLTKQQILELYLGYAPYGGTQRGAEQAARAWLGKAASQLTLADAAWMAVLARSPARLDPSTHPLAALPDQKRLLQRMFRLGWIDAQQLQVAINQPILVAPDATRYRAPHLVQWLRATLVQPLAEQPQAVYTTVDAALQAEVAAMARHHVAGLRDRNVGNAAVVVLDNATAQVLVLLGSTDYGDAVHQGANNGALALRQPGSTIKAFTYAAAFARDDSPATVLSDLPKTYDTPQGAWSPGNYGATVHGPVRARVALASSLNLAAVDLADRVGPAALLRDLARLGFSSLRRDPGHYGLALTLGDGEVSLLELTAAFATFAGGGQFLPPRCVTALVDRSGQRLAVPVGAAVPVYSPQVAWQVFDVLADPTARALAFGRGGPLELPFAVAAKTGTSKGFRDNWALGSTAKFTVGVWVGNFDGSAMRDVSGVTGAAPLLHDILLRLHRGGSPVAPQRPDGLHSARICALSGQRATPLCGQTVDEWLLPGQLPQPCPWHVPGQPHPRVAVPPAFRAWAIANPALADQLAPQSVQQATLLRIVQPRTDSQFMRAPAQPAAQQQLALKAEAADPRWQLQWRVDGRLVGAGPVDQQVLWPLQAGAHRTQVEALDGSGTVVARDVVQFAVLGSPEPGQPP